MDSSVSSAFLEDKKQLAMLYREFSRLSVSADQPASKSQPLYDYCTAATSVLQQMTNILGKYTQAEQESQFTSLVQHYYFPATLTFLSRVNDNKATARIHKTPHITARVKEAILINADDYFPISCNDGSCNLVHRMSMDTSLSDNAQLYGRLSEAFGFYPIEADEFPTRKELREEINDIAAVDAAVQYGYLKKHLGEDAVNSILTKFIPAKHR